jgi:two-component system chemotaxis sensor kinase CheA
VAVSPENCRYKTGRYRTHEGFAGQEFRLNMKIDLSQFRETFLQESAEHVASMEDGLLQLRSAPDDVELMNAIFRAAHSIKGGAGTFGLADLVHFTHVLENLLDRLRAGEMAATEKVIALLLQSVDGLRGLLEDGGRGEVSLEIADLQRRLEALVANEPAVQASVGAPVADLLDGSGPGAAAMSEGGERRYRVGFQPHAEILGSGSNPLLLVRNLAALGQVHSCDLDASRLPALGELDPRLFSLSWTMELSTASPEAEIREVFEFVEHLATISVACLEGERVPGSGFVSTTVAVTAQAAQPAEPAETAGKGAARRAPRADTESTTIRVATEKVDRLIDLMGELVIAHVMTEQMVEKVYAGVPAPAAPGGGCDGAQYARAARAGDGDPHAAGGESFPALHAHRV